MWAKFSFFPSHFFNMNVFSTFGFLITEEFTNIFIKSSQLGFSDSIYNNIKGHPNYLQDHLKTTLKLNMNNNLEQT